MKKIVCVHLYNDFSGSPLVLSTVIKGFRKKGIDVDLFTSSGSKGFLSNLDVNYQCFSYEFKESKWMRLFFYLYSQVILFFKLLRYRNEDVIIYINTLLPFGAAFAGKLMGKKVIYHVHETSINPVLLKQFLKFVIRITATEAIFVSKFLRDQEPINGIKSSIVYNALSNEFIKYVPESHVEDYKNTAFVVLMLCSLKDYKGVKEFVQLSQRLPHLQFELVLNANMEEINHYFAEISIPDNLIIFPRQANVHLFYQRANLVLNLSHPEQWIETFGMTLLEAMQYGIPSIGPAVGGPAEIIENDVNGYKIDQRQLTTISNKIKLIASNSALYQRLSNNAYNFAKRFSTEHMNDQIFMIIGL